MKKTIYALFLLALVFANYTNAQEVKINYTGSGSSGSGLVIESDGTVRSDGSATTWADLNVYPDLRGTGSNNPTWETFKNNVKLLRFDNGSLKEVFFTVQIPHSYRENQPLKPHVHWASTTAASSTSQVEWELEYTWANHKSAFDNTTTIKGKTCVSYNVSAELTYTADQHLITPLDDISGSRNISSFLVCRLYRDGTTGNNTDDTYNDNVFLLGVDFHYEMDTQGSRSDYTK